MGKTKLNKLEKSWILYDVGNSAFTMLFATLIPIYFNALAEMDGMSSADYLAYWGYAASFVTLTVAVLGPVLGTIADTKNFKKPIFMLALAVGVIGCSLMGFMPHWVSFLAVFVLAKIGYSSSLVFYDSMLQDVTSEDRVDDVSSQGYAWGYIGSCIPFVCCLVLVLFGGSFGLNPMQAMTAGFLLTGVWWLIMTLPLLKGYRQKNYVETPKHVVRSSFARIGSTLRSVKDQKQIFLFLLAFFCYIDGVYTIIDMATAYGTALGLDTNGLLLALLLTQIVAFPSALFVGKLSYKYETRQMLPVFIGAYICIAIFAFFLDTQIEFWILAVLVGLFQGGVQALSRSHFTKIIPQERSGEYFGLYDICGKGASFLGTMLVSVTTQITGHANVGIGMLVILFVIGQILFSKSCKMAPAKIK